MELLAAEADAREKKRKAEGRPLEAPAKVAGAIENGAGAGGVGDEEANKRRKLLQEAIALDKDDESDEEDKGDRMDKDDRYELKVF